MYLYLFGIVLVLTVEIYADSLINLLGNLEVKPSVIEFFKSVSNIFIVSVVIALIKSLLYIKNNARRNFKDLFLEILISVSIGTTVGYLVGLWSEFWSYVAACVVSNIGSKYQSVFDKLLDIVINGIKAKVDSLAGKDSDDSSTQP